ncbi:hypothetical protein [Paracoccus homiensis]|nr:hypothetical protein [Paracoccus homiensis]
MKVAVSLVNSFREPHIQYVLRRSIAGAFMVPISPKTQRSDAISPEDLFIWMWLVENAGLVQAAVGIVTALVWFVYLQVLVSGVRRQRRTEILIHLGGSRSLDGRLFISNLGFEPIYILEILLTLRTPYGERETSVADRTEIAKEEVKNPVATTSQGPLKSGEFVDIGSFDDLLQRAQRNTSDDLQADGVSRVELKVAAISAASSAVVAAKRQFCITFDAGKCRIRPKTVYATQIRSWWGRCRLKRELEMELEQ